MTYDLQEAFWTKYPKIFNSKDVDMYQSCMYQGIETNDGWSVILSDLCDKLQNISDENNVQVIALQVKEKFGKMAFYYDTIFLDSWINGTITCSKSKLMEVITNKIDTIVNEAIETTRHTCEECGQEGKIHSMSGWFKCICLDCLNDQK